MSDYCIGCDTFTHIIHLFIIPGKKKPDTWICEKCIATFNARVGNAELQNGGWDNCKRLEDPEYMHFYRDLILGECK